MRAKSLWPCEIIIYSKCFWKPFMLFIILTSLLIFLYSVFWPVEKSKDLSEVRAVIYEQEERLIPEVPNLLTTSIFSVAKPQFERQWSDLETSPSNSFEMTLNPDIPITFPPDIPITFISDLSVTFNPDISFETPSNILETNPAVQSPRPVIGNKPKKKKESNPPKKPATNKPKTKSKMQAKWKKPEPNFRWCPGEKNVPDVDCRALFNGEETAVEKFKDWKPGCEISDRLMEKLSENCSKLHQYFPFEFNHQFPDDTIGYPLAFILVVEKNAEQVLRLLQSIYRPQNLYCLTYDAHSKNDFKRAMDNLVDCYPNILTPDQHHGINWGGFSILEANVKCLQTLHQHSNKWKYVQMLSWNDYPLKTNEEMIEIFKILNGSNDSELKDGEPYRYIRYYAEDRMDHSKDTLTKPVPPGNLYIYKGSLATSLTREFVDFVFRDKIAQQFYNYSKTMLIPEEQFWATLIHNLHINPPGGFPGICKHYFWYRQKKKKPWVSRYQMWKELKDPCEGQWTHKSCVFGVGDLWSIKPRLELIAHKIYSDFQAATAYCLSQLQFNRTYLGRSDDDTLDFQYYRDLPAVKFHNLADKSRFNCVT